MTIRSSAETISEPLSISPKRRRYLLTRLLKSVSRAIYLSIRILPSDIREPVAVAYLLARAADTIADSASVPAQERIRHLRKFRHALESECGIDVAFELAEALSGSQRAYAERDLLDSLPEVFTLLRSLRPDDANNVSSLALTLTRGMLFDLTTFHSEDSEKLAALQSPEQLDHYCYLVAGCVGEFLTAMITAYTKSLARMNDADTQRMRALGVQFGKALQMTNILRDLPKDLRLGRCYLPQSELRRLGLHPSDLIQNRNLERARPILEWGVIITLNHFNAAEQYTLTIPRRNLRLRLAALWPMLIGLKTLAALARGNQWLNPNYRIKVPRRSVYGIIMLSILTANSNTLTKLWIRRTSNQVKRALHNSR